MFHLQMHIHLSMDICELDEEATTEDMSESPPRTPFTSEYQSKSLQREQRASWELRHPVFLAMRLTLDSSVERGEEQPGKVIHGVPHMLIEHIEKRQRRDRAEDFGQAAVARGGFWSRHAEIAGTGGGEG